jgi:hypothetical protein
VAGTIASPYSRYALNGNPALRGQAATAAALLLTEAVMSEKKPTRKGSTLIVVRVTPDEKAEIELLAKQTGHSTSAHLRLLGQGYVPKSIVDNGKIMELARINGDLGRLVGLLKLWLSNDARTAQFGENTLRAALARIEDTQNKMLEIMKPVVMHRADL